MKELTLDRIARMTEGKIVSGNGKETFDSVSIDSRTVKKNGIFFAMKGEVTDGHRYIESAVANGAGLVVTDHVCDCFGACQIVCADTFKALQNMARAYRAMFDIPFICVTGSSGKTTNKDLIASVLSVRYNTLKTAGNLNSTTGVPLTMFELDDCHEIAVIEVSMSAPGEIIGNAEIVRPDTAVITNIGTAHIEFLGSRENIFRAKSEILEYMHEGNAAIVNGEDDFLGGLTSDVYEVIHAGTDVKAYNVLQQQETLYFDCEIEGKMYPFAFGYVGHHNLINCLTAIAAGLRYGLTPEEIQKGFDMFSPSSNRMQIETVKGITLINDTYNANAEAFEAAMDFLCSRAEGRKVVVASDMYELGEFTEELHTRVGRKAADIGIDLLIACGEYGPYYVNGYNEKGGKRALFYPGKKELIADIKNLLENGDTVLFKASRGVQLEEVFNYVKENL